MHPWPCPAPALPPAGWMCCGHSGPRGGGQCPREDKRKSSVMTAWQSGAPAPDSCSEGNEPLSINSHLHLSLRLHSPPIGCSHSPALPSQAAPLAFASTPPLALSTTDLLGEHSGLVPAVILPTPGELGLPPPALPLGPRERHVRRLLGLRCPPPMSFQPHSCAYLAPLGFSKAQSGIPMGVKARPALEAKGVPRSRLLGWGSCLP